MNNNNYKAKIKSLLNIVLLSILPGITFNAAASIYNTTYDYDVQAGIVTKTDPNGKAIEYHYDAVNNLTKIILDAAGTPTQLEYFYDPTDQLERITYPGGEQLYGYDDYDRLESITDFGAAGPLLNFQYDHQDRLTWIIYSAANGAVCYEYDADGRMTRVGRVYNGSGTMCSAADEKTDYSYDAQGRLSGIAYPNGTRSYVIYDNNTGQVKEAGHRRTNGTLIYSDRFDYVSGTRLYNSITRTTATTSKTTRYTYDAYQRLKTVLESDGRRTVYEYDPFGNRTRETITNINDANATGGSPKAYGVYDYEYAANSNRLDRILLNGQEQEAYQYDNAGRMIQRNKGGSITSYDYDDRGLLTQVTMPGTTVSYTYDALGARKTKTVNGVTTRYLTAPIFGMPHVLAELDTGMSFKSTYVYAGHQQLKEEPVAGNHGKDLYLLHDGMVGSITHAVDNSGVVKNQYDYDAFGIRSEVNAGASDSLKHYGYTGEEVDEETGLVYLRARYYDPGLGRFISADPFWGRLEQPASQNRYAYVHNNPVLYTDPSGHRALFEREENFLYGYFGDTLDYNKIDIGEAWSSRAASPYGSKITLPSNFFEGGDVNKPIDLTDDLVVSKFGHEAFHVFQRTVQNQSVTMKAIPLQISYAFGGNPYRYDNTVSDPYLFYSDVYREANVEQAGQIVEDMIFYDRKGWGTSKFSYIRDEISASYTCK